MAQHFVLSSFGNFGCLGLVTHLLLVIQKALLWGVGGSVWGNENDYKPVESYMHGGWAEKK